MNRVDKVYLPLNGSSTFKTHAIVYTARYYKPLVQAGANEITVPLISLG